MRKFEANNRQEADEQTRADEVHDYDDNSNRVNTMSEEDTFPTKEGKLLNRRNQRRNKRNQGYFS